MRRAWGLSVPQTRKHSHSCFIIFSLKIFNSTYAYYTRSNNPNMVLGWVVNSRIKFENILLFFNIYIYILETRKRFGNAGWWRGNTVTWSGRGIGSVTWTGRAEPSQSRGAAMRAGVEARDRNGPAAPISGTEAVPWHGPARPVAQNGGVGPSRTGPAAPICGTEPICFGILLNNPVILRCFGCMYMPICVQGY